MQRVALPRGAAERVRLDAVTATRQLQVGEEAALSLPSAMEESMKPSQPTTPTSVLSPAGVLATVELMSSRKNTNG